jgi:hypothetical protein
MSPGRELGQTTAKRADLSKSIRHKKDEFPQSAEIGRIYKQA